MAKTTAVRNLIVGVITVFVFLVTASETLAQGAGYLKIVTAQGVIEGKSKDPAHMNWIPLTSVQIADVNQDGAADRESSAPSVSEVVVSVRGGKPTPAQTAGQQGQAPTAPADSVRTAREQASAHATGKSMAQENSVKSPRDLATGQASGKRQHKPITIVKEWDAATPKLQALQTTGTLIPEVEIYLPANTGAARAGHYKLKEVLISSIQPAGGGGKTPLESVSFTYQKIEWTK
jgi:type VI secretion system Hcp family effector